MPLHRRRARPSRARIAFASSCVALAALRAHAHASPSSSSSSSRPGVRPWITERAELHGLSSNALERASANVETIVDRDCFVVAKDGALVHESYYHTSADDASTTTSTSTTTFSVDGAAGALAVVFATGIAVEQGLFGLDEPLGKFGLASVTRTFGKEYADQVTVRQVLAQTHGGGRRAPGTAFERDDATLDLIGELIEARSGLKLERWARMHVAEPLGVPGMFGDVDVARRLEAPVASRLSLRRDARMSCRDVAKLAQVFVNKGAWLGEDGKVKQLFDPSFALTVMSVSYPSLNQAHGLMTWLHVPARATGSKCCKPHTSALSCGESAEALDGPILGGDAPHAPVAIVVGDEGSMIYMLPESRVVVVTLGRTVAGTPACPVAPSDVVSAPGHGRRDDAFLVRTLWSAMRDGLKPLTSADAADATSRRSDVGTSSAERVWKKWEEKHHPSRFSDDDDDDDDDGNRHASRGERAAARVGHDEEASSDGTVSDGHATYGDVEDEYDDDDDTARAAADAYRARQLAYARDMQEREYKKYESRIQRDYQSAIKANQEAYQDAMRAAQEEFDAARRAKLEDDAATAYMNGVNTIERAGADSLEQLEKWRAATLPPDATSNRRTSRGDARDADARHLETMQRALERNVREMSAIGAQRSAPPRARLGAAAASAETTSTTTTTTTRGSCVCGCPNTPSAAASSCFDVDASEFTSADQAARACDAMHSRARLGCPHTGIVQKCGEIVGKRGQASKDLECRQVRRCPQTDAEAKSIEFLAAVFDCRPNAFAACAYVPAPCAHSHVIVRPATATTTTTKVEVEPSVVRLSRGDVDAERAAAHRFSDHDHVVMRHNALTRWALRASPEVTVGLAVAVLALALVTIASKWPTTVTGGEHPFASKTKRVIQARGQRRRGTAVAESAPLLIRHSSRATENTFNAEPTPTPTPTPTPRVVETRARDEDKDEEAVIVNVSKTTDATPQIRPIAVLQSQTLAFAEELHPTVEISPRAPPAEASSSSSSGEE